MSVYLNKRRAGCCLLSLFIVGLNLPAPARSADVTGTQNARDASFLSDDSPAAVNISTPVFSGLAAPPELTAPPMAVPTPAAKPVAVQPPAPSPVVEPTTSVATAPIAQPTPTPAPTPASPSTPAAATPTPLAEGGGESIGSGDGELGPAIWKGTARPTAEKLLAMTSLTASPVLNDLLRRLLQDAATPPQQDATATPDSAQTLTALRAERLVTFGATPEAWALASHADPKLIDDITMHFVAEAALADNIDGVCDAIPALAKSRASVDWQKDQIICAIRNNSDGAVAPASVGEQNQGMPLGAEQSRQQTAQPQLEAMRTASTPDAMFLEVAARTAPGDSKPLPSQLTPLTPPMLALLQLTNQPLPGELYSHPDFALAPALLRDNAKQDVARLGLAERAAQRGVIDAATLGEIYRQSLFTPDALSFPLTASESGARQRALLYQAALNEKDSGRRISFAVKFVQSAPPALLDSAGSLAAAMLGSVAADASHSDNAVTLAQIYMLAGRGDAALAWLRIASHSTVPATADALRNLWPQFALAGLESESAFKTNLGIWLDAALKSGDARAAHENAAATLLLLDAAGFVVPDSEWDKILTPSRNEKHIALSPVLLTRLQEASTAGRRGETLLLAAIMAGDGDVPLPIAVAITHALRVAGFKSEAATFARTMLALSLPVT